MVHIYSVVQNTPGYLPDSEPYWTRNKRQAEMVAADMARQFRDDGYRVSGRAGDWFYSVDDGSLGYVIEITEWDVTGDEWAEYQKSL